MKMGHKLSIRSSAASSSRIELVPATALRPVG